MGRDLGDKSSRYCVLDREGEVVQEGSVSTTRKAMRKCEWKQGESAVGKEAEQSRRERLRLVVRRLR
jgi:hypothetical protein